MTTAPDSHSAHSPSAVPSAVLATRLQTVLATRRGWFGAGLACWVVGLGLIVSLFLVDWGWASPIPTGLGPIFLVIAAFFWIRGVMVNPRINDLREQVAWARANEHPAGDPQPATSSGNLAPLLTFAGVIVSTVGGVVVAVVSS